MYLDTTKLTLFSLITKGIALKFLTFLFLVCNIQVKMAYATEKQCHILLLSVPTFKFFFYLW